MDGNFGMLACVLMYIMYIGKSATPFHMHWPPYSW